MEQELLQLGIAGVLGVGIVKYLLDKEKKRDLKEEQFSQEIKKSEENRIKAYEARFSQQQADFLKREETLRQEAKERETALLATLNNISSTVNTAFGDFSKTINNATDSLLEVSVQLGNLGQRMDKLETNMDNINMYLAKNIEN